MKTKHERGRLQDASVEPVRAYYTSTFSKGQRIKTSSCGPKMPQNQANIQQCTYHASSNVFSFLLFCSPPPPMSTACHYRKLQLICPHSWKWIIGRRPIIKHSSHAWSFILLLVPTYIFGFKKYEYCKREQEKKCQSKWCLQQQEFMSHGI